jgi:hypothetical protein
MVVMDHEDDAAGDVDGEAWQFRWRDFLQKQDYDRSEDDDDYCYCDDADCASERMRTVESGLPVFSAGDSHPDYHEHILY